MTRLARAGAVLSAVVTALGSAALVAGASVSAAKPNPCKLLKSAEIEKVLGQDVGKAKKGLTTAVTRTCEWKVQPSAEFPDGVIDTFIQTVGAKIAYDTNSKDAAVEKVPQLGKAYYDERLDAVTVLKGKVLLNVQGVFLSTQAGVGAVHRKDALIDLAKIARRRV